VAIVSKKQLIQETGVELLVLLVVVLLRQLLRQLQDQPALVIQFADAVHMLTVRYAADVAPMALLVLLKLVVLMLVWVLVVEEDVILAQSLILRVKILLVYKITPELVAFQPAQQIQIAPVVTEYVRHMRIPVHVPPIVQSL
jgi:hypothetical protein